MPERLIDYVIFGWLLALSAAWWKHRSVDRREFDEIKNLLAEIKADLMRGDV